MNHKEEITYPVYSAQNATHMPRLVGVQWFARTVAYTQSLVLNTFVDSLRYYMYVLLCVQRFQA